MPRSRSNAYIFEDDRNWAAFRLAERDDLRAVENNEVNKTLSCKDERRGFFTYECVHCGITKTVYFGCSSRICTNCGKNHTDKWAKNIQNALFNVPHRHAVFPAVLWPIVRSTRFLQKVLMDAAIAAINDTISHKHRNVANTRLHRYDGKSVTFWYKDREGERHFVTMKVREFIKALIQHIPDRQFKMIRYYITFWYI